MQPRVMTPEALGLAPADLEPRVRLVRRFVPTVHGRCEMIGGASAAEIAARLVARLRADGVLA
jgi:hypothetical protein